MRLRTLIVVLLVLAVVAVGGAAVFWWFASDELERGIVDLRDDLRADGIEASSAPPAIGGFPFRLTARFDAPAVTLPGGMRWSGPTVVGSAWLWDLESIRLDAPGRHLFTLPEAELALEAAAATARLGFAQGLLRELALELEQATLANLEFGQTLSAERLAFSAGPLPALDGREETTAFALALAGVPLPPQAAEAARLLGDHLALLVLEGSLAGPLLPGRPRDMAAAWRDAGGVLELSRIELDWGALALQGSGTLSLDSAFRPLGAFSFQTAGLPELVARLQAEGLLDPEAGATLAKGLQALAAGSDAQGRTLVTLPVTLQDGTLYLGLIAVGQLRSLF